MAAPGARSRMARDAVLFREACNIDPRVLAAAFSARGLDDFPPGGLGVLGSIFLTGSLESDLTREMGITGPAASQTADLLIQGGYLASQADHDDRGRTGITLTRSARVAFTVALDAVMAARWADFPFRQGDIVISTLPKSGTTWMQMICALLIFQTPDLPAPLQELSPWIDTGYYGRDELYARLAAQDHRRFIKTHMSLGEIPADPGVTYIMVVRDPLDVAASMYHQDRRDQPPKTQRTNEPEPDWPGKWPDELHEWLLRWIAEEDSPRGHLNSFPGAMRRLTNVWARRDEPNVVLVHYDELSANLEGEMRRLAAQLGVTVPATAWPELVKAATFGQMKAAASRLIDVDDAPGFFRRGASGTGRELLTKTELARYYARTAELAPPDLLAWLHRDEQPEMC